MNNVNNDPKLLQVLSKLVADTLDNKLIWSQVSETQHPDIYSKLKFGNPMMLTNKLLRMYYSTSEKQKIGLTLNTDSAFLSFFAKDSFTVLSIYPIEQSDFFRIENAIQKKINDSNNALDDFLNN